MEPPNLLAIVRHGESVRNAVKGDGRFVSVEQRPMLGGVPDRLIELTATGHRQANQVGDALHYRYGLFDHIYTSGYTRADQTVQGISAAYQECGHDQLLAETDILIRERDAGYAGDMTRPEARAAFPWLEEYWHRCGDFLARPPGGESMADVVVRIQVFLDRIYTLHPHQKILVVTHGAAIQAFKFVLERWDFRQAEERFSRLPPGNASVTAFRSNRDFSGLIPDHATDSAEQLTLCCPGRPLITCSDTDLGASVNSFDGSPLRHEA